MKLKQKYVSSIKCDDRYTLVTLSSFPRDTRYVYFCIFRFSINAWTSAVYELQFKWTKNCLIKSSATMMNLIHEFENIYYAVSNHWTEKYLFSYLALFLCDN